MIRRLRLTAPLALLLAAASPAVTASDIGVADHEVTGARDTALVLALDAAVDRATEAVGTCRESGAPFETCLCQSRPEIAEVRAALDAALDANPEWRDTALFLRDKGDGQSLTIFLDTVARMAEPPPCP